MLVNARHSWVGDACLARGDAEAGGHGFGAGYSGSGKGESMGSPRSTGGGNGQLSDCLHTPSSTGAAPEVPA